MSTIRASEIGTYLYCKRAWYYQKKGYPQENQQELAAGTKIHLKNTRTVMMSGCLRIVAYCLLITAIVLLAIYLTGQLI
jgi:CRISPR/Cas system-associated exonuclease Cas4 (RecB family)